MAQLELAINIIPIIVRAIDAAEAAIPKSGFWCTEVGPREGLTLYRVQQRNGCDRLV